MFSRHLAEKTRISSRTIFPFLNRQRLLDNKYLSYFLAMQSGFKQRKFSSNHLNFALNSVLPNEKAYLELINTFGSTQEITAPFAAIYCFLLSFLGGPKSINIVLINHMICHETILLKILNNSRWGCRLKERNRAITFFTSYQIPLTLQVWHDRQLLIN